MTHFYLNSLYGKKRKHGAIYKELQREIFGKVLNWEEMQKQESDKLRQLLIDLENRVMLMESPIDPEKLARAIQHSRSGIGGSAMTRYNCKFCGKEEVWTNTAVPGICKGCATEMALHIAKHCPNILKDEIQKEITPDKKKV